MTIYTRVHLKNFLVPLILPLLILLSGGCHRDAPPGAKRVKALITADGMQHTLFVVMNHNLSRVTSGSPGEAHAANWLADTFSHYGLRPGGSRQTFFVEYPLPDNNEHQFARNVVGQTPGMRVINGGILLTTVYNRLDTDESQSDSEAVKASAARVALLLEIANATAGRPGDTPIYFSARSERSIPEAKDVSVVLNLQNSPAGFGNDTLHIAADSIPSQWKPFLGNLSDSLVHVDFDYHGLSSSVSPNVKINILIPTKAWTHAADNKQRQKGLNELAHSAQIIRKLLYRIAMLQPEISTPGDSTQFAPHPG
ncbi:MAG TPA: hypothetical protein VKA08_17710 [Balneolales bacterium]|nr:hypothetical protein [Balneolales bacterium]